MARIPTEVINDIRQKSKIEDVISQYIEVIKKGNSYVAVCPFHDDHDPSMHISSSKQIFKCFVCDTAGDVFSFVQKYENISYPQAVKKVAEIIGYKYDFGSDYEKAVFEESIYHKVMKEAVIYCQHELNSEAGQKAKKYLLDRGLTVEQLEKYQFGYNPSNNSMYNFLSKKGYEDKDMIQANVARLTQQGITDVFFDRITIPIHDQDGHPIGFTARSMNPNAESKYINSTDTPIFRKSDVLFNYHRALGQIRKDKFVILVEGPMDVMAFDKAGFSNAVCSMGTSCTKEQLQVLKRITSNIVVAYDGDTAGQNASYKVGQLAQQSGFRVVVLNNNSQLDPDEIVREKGSNTLVEMVRKPKTWIEFVFSYFQRQYDLNNYNSKKEFSTKIMEEINKLTDSFDRDNYIDQLAQLTGFTTAVLIDNLANNKTVRKIEPEKKTERYKPAIMDGVTIAERTILKQMILSSQMCETYKNEVKMLKSKEANKLALYIIEFYNKNDELNISEFVGELPNDELKSLVYEVVDSELLTNEVSLQVFTDAVLKIKESIIDDKIDELKRAQKQSTIGSEKISISAEVAQLRKEKIKLRQGQEDNYGKKE